MASTSVRCVLALVLLVLSVTVARAADPTPPTATWLLDQVKTLSAPAMDGRGSGTPGAERAGQYIGRVFSEAGLTPAGDNGTFFQSFPVSTGIRLGAGNALTVVAPTARDLTLGKEFLPLAVSADGTAEGDVVFVGYGITARDLGYDDYADVDVRDKIVLAMTGEPRSDDATSPFRRPEAYHYSERSHKIINAREHGARAILLVAHPAAPRQALPPLRGITQPWNILASSLTAGVADAFLAPGRRRLVDVAGEIDRTLTPHPFPLPGVRVHLTVALTRERGTAANVVGILRGTDAKLREEAIVIGAHYDHLGRGGEGSLAPDQVGTIHPGADDNASGTAAVMGLARAFAQAGGLPRTLIFVTFAGEEMGLLGSAHYVRHPAMPLERTVLMVNLDMVGRLRNDRLFVGGADSATGLRHLVEDVARGLGLTLQLRGDPFSPSDHTSFYTAGRPVLFFFTGAHGDYHRPTDTWEKINAPGLVSVATLTMRVVTAVAREATPPAYVKMVPPARSQGSGYGPFFGVVPDFGEAERPGVRITGVRPGSPAERAGVRAGDIIVRFAGIDVKTLEDLTFALRGRRAGDRVEVVIDRDGQQHQFSATLEHRR